MFFIFSPDSKVEVIINPSYEPIISGEDDVDFAWEGCFSIPYAVGHIKRYKHIKIQYQNEDGNIVINKLHGWPARVWQHENDHLNGLLYDDIKTGKCIDKKQFSSKKDLEEFYNSIKEKQQNERKATKYNRED